MKTTIPGARARNPCSTIGPHAYGQPHGELQWPAVSLPAGVTLLVWRDRLEPPGWRLPRRVRGVYDPTLQRIELFGCTPAAPDAELVRTLLHELAHAAGVSGEDAATRLADGAFERLDLRDVAEIAHALRSTARSRPAPSSDSSRSCCPLSIGL